LRKINTLLRDKKGSALVLGSLLLLFILSVFYLLFTYTEYKTTASYVQTIAESTLEEYTAVQGRLKMLSIKNGTDYTVALDQAAYTKLLQEALCVDNNMTGYREGRLAFRISDVRLRYNEDKRINSQVSFTMHLPIYLGSTVVTSFDGTVQVGAKYDVTPYE